MNKISLAVCETDDDYRGRFVTYLIEHKSNQFEVYAFSKANHFMEVLGRQSFDMVLLGSGFEDVKATVHKMQIPLLWLCEMITEGEADNLLYKEVFRYQPMQAILHEIQVFAGIGALGEQMPQGYSGRLEVLGVYSPIQHEMQMPFSIVLADKLAESRKVLYINLIENSGFLELFNLAAGYDMGDIILRLRNKQLSAEVFLKCLSELGRIYYIQPFHNLKNLKEAALQDYVQLLEYVEASTDFDVVIFDFDKGVGQLAEVFDYCQSIYCLVKSGYYYECRTHEFLTYMENCGLHDGEGKLCMLNLPFSAKQLRGGDVKKQLLWSEFGDYVRNYIAGGSA